LVKNYLPQRRKGAKGENKKSEARNPKLETNSKQEMQKNTMFQTGRIDHSGFWIFGI
jgi:hypothetical protein